MSELPTREETRQMLDDPDTWEWISLYAPREVLGAYADGDLMTRAEWEASIESVVTVNPNSDNTFGWMEHVKGPSIETTETMLGSGRYGLVKLNVEEDS